MATTRKDWPRLAEAVRERRTDLGLTQQDVSAAGGPGTATMRLIEGALQDGYTPGTLRRLEGALRWAPGSVRAVLAGGDPAPLPEKAPRPVQPAALSAAAAFPAPAVTASRPPSDVRAHLLAALSAVNGPLRERVLAEAASGRPFADPVEAALWGSPGWTETEKAEEIALFRAMRAEHDRRAAETG